MVNCVLLAMCGCDCVDILSSIDLLLIICFSSFRSLNNLIPLVFSLRGMFVYRHDPRFILIFYHHESLRPNFGF